jgi:transcriptional regulator with XRE-family HTH domain
VSTTTRVTWEDFGPFLRRIREHQGVSQERLARHLGCHRVHIYRLEHGRRHPSKLLLRSLRHMPTLELSLEETDYLGLFELLLEYRCSALDIGAAPMYLPIRA